MGKLVSEMTEGEIKKQRERAKRNYHSPTEKICAVCGKKIVNSKSYKYHPGCFLKKYKPTRIKRDATLKTKAGLFVKNNLLGELMLGYFS